MATKPDDLAAKPVWDPGLTPVVLVAHKSDKDEEREVSTAEGFALAKELGCMFVESSAKHCVNVENAFFLIGSASFVDNDYRRSSHRG
ncbi:uncharacterized protein Z518_01876 [Rhinocladiella mackenziei CBS 650.93]|uniref:small monomeric GTPase n=1 Tax=Rhinocladiella mackenziei CBS 650.93 TaxID=1442369 RepID=A0A0D2H9Q8_9EURO|nr:uncharacterized protein Z518_01876 [Rhinocladiella mackenziei CBS 650.93]KIX07223.1 hypothetical protein Z518_01876 [Rhinocladiella mackenziei CBS 650.93]